MSSSASVTTVPARPARLLTQNREMRAIGVWNWTLPALAARLPDGRTQVTCPAASACTRICYARNGTYLFPAVKAKHTANLVYVLDFSGRTGREGAYDLPISIADIFAMRS
jgi:hypothetical protein